MKIKVKDLRAVVGSWPPKGGEHLGHYVWKNTDLRNEKKITIDFKGCAPAMLISSFFGGFRLVIEEIHDLTLDNITWETDHDFQLDSIKYFTAPHSLYKKK